MTRILSDSLHQQVVEAILKLPHTDPPKPTGRAWPIAHLNGHEHGFRDARRAAADLVRATLNAAPIAEREGEAPQAGMPQGWREAVLYAIEALKATTEYRVGNPATEQATAGLQSLSLRIAPQVDAQPDPFHVVVPGNEAQTAEPCAGSEGAA